MVSTRRQRARSTSSELVEPQNSNSAVPAEEELQTRVENKNEVGEAPPKKSDLQPVEEDNINDNNDGRQQNEDGNDEGQQVEFRISKTAETESQTKAAKKSKKKKKQKNELTKLIPGYTATRELNTSSLNKYRPAGGIQALQRRAERTDASTKDFVLEASKRHTTSMQKGSNGLLPSSYGAAYSSFKKGKRRAPDNSAGKGWFGMEATPMTDELKTDLALIRNRNYLDPKKFYKNADKHHKVVQLGTVIEGAAEFYSSRLTKKQRRNNLTEEIMADPSTADYAQKKFRQFERENTYQAKKRAHKPKRGKKY